MSFLVEGFMSGFDFFIYLRLHSDGYILLLSLNGFICVVCDFKLPLWGVVLLDWLELNRSGRLVNLQCRKVVFFAATGTLNYLEVALHLHMQILIRPRFLAHASQSFLAGRHW